MFRNNNITGRYPTEQKKSQLSGLKHPDVKYVVILNADGVGGEGWKVPGYSFSFGHKSI